MLIELSVENIAIMDRATARFGPGLTAITGETGAGKSLMIGAISLCLGERADTSLIRKGATRALVHAVFDAPSSVREMLTDMGYDIGDEEVILQRELAIEGKSICRINGRAAPLGILKQIGDALVDLHGQHDHQSLLHSTTHLAMLDGYAGEEASSLRLEVAKIWAELTSAKNELADLERDAQERERMLDILRFQINEIEDFGIAVGEVERLQLELKRLQSAEELETSLREAQDALYMNEVSARTLVQVAIKRLAMGAQLDHGLAKVVDTLRQAELSIEEVEVETKQIADTVEFSPEKIESVAARLSQFNSLRRKYGETEESILQFLESARASFAMYENSERLGQDISSIIDSLESDYARNARNLSGMRVKFAASLGQAVRDELRQLGMSNAQFEVRLAEKPPSREGVDQCEFLLSANVGEDAKPLSKIASGGEMSRVMLAIKTVMAGRGGIPTMIFDEIDSGLGGKTAAIVAKKLAALAQNYQVLTITHVPQIAGAANSQISIVKVDAEGKTTTTLRELSDDERVQEIARMVGGENISAEAVANARQLLLG